MDTELGRLWWLCSAGILVLGVCVGSFLNLCIWRIPQKISLRGFDFHCPDCEARLSTGDLVPLVSYALLRGRCRHCGARIAPRYPAVEALTGILYLLCYWQLPSLGKLLPALLLISVLIPVAFIDAEHSIIPNGLMLFGAAAGLGCMLLFHRDAWRTDIIGAVAPAAILFFVDVLSRLILRQEGMGGGDVKLMAVVGLFLGLRMVLLALMLAVVAGGLVGATMLLTRKIKPGGYFPFGPFLAVGSCAALLYGGYIIPWYHAAAGFLLGMMAG